MRTADRPLAELPTHPSSDVAELADRFGLTATAAAQLSRLQSLLADDPRAPTSVRDPRQILLDHLADSLVALEVAPLRGARQVADIGSGAGLPGLPLAIALPQASFALVESAARKCEFLERAVRVCGLGNAEVIHSRVETWAAPPPADFDVVTCRAVASLEVVVEYGAPLLSVAGHLLVWQGRRDLQVERRAERAAGRMGLRPVEVRQVWPYRSAHDRHLHLFSKVRETPAGFPRRPGAATKRPLGTT